MVVKFSRDSLRKAAAEMGFVLSCICREPRSEFRAGSKKTRARIERSGEQ
jgi:hypothetical protein